MKQPTAPLFQLYHDLDPATEAALRASIDRFGVIVPVLTDRQGNIIDGHQRARIATELGRPYTTLARTVESEEEAREIARSLNEDRRAMAREQRLPVVAELRQQGHSERAIAGAVGVSKAQVHRDLQSIGSPEPMPERVRTADGRSYPARRPAVSSFDPDEEEPEPLFADGEEDAIADELTAALDREPEPAELEQAKAECIESKAVPDWTPRKPDLGGGVSHPARYSAELLPILAELLRSTVGAGSMVLDPFAGTGRIHDLHPEFDTYGIELEPEWAGMHERTQVGDARVLPFDVASIDAIVTSPTYGNRLADSHQASDPERRRSYTHDLGRDLTTGNSGGMHWRNGAAGSTEYRALHWPAWIEAYRVLRPGGVFILNMKDHWRGGILQPVTSWHTWALGSIGLEYVDSMGVPTRDLRQGANGAMRQQETVHLFRKADW